MNIDDPVKTRIFAALPPLFEEMKGLPPYNLRYVMQGFDPLQPTRAQPSLTFFDGAEKQLGEGDTRGRTYEFELICRVETTETVKHRRLLVAKIQSILEANLQLGGLVNNIWSSGESPFWWPTNGRIFATDVMFRVQYRRVRGHADQTY